MITIVGAGPVGLFTAKRLAERGLDVTVFERGGTGNKTCGGLLAREFFNICPEALEAVVNVIDGARIHAGRTVTVEKKGVAFVVDRVALEDVLLSTARAEGINVHLHTPWNGKGDVVIGADGLFSSVRKRVNDVQPEFVVGVQTVCRGEYDTYVDVHFGDFAPGFFGWVIPLDEKYARVGIGVHPSSGHDPGALFRMFLRRLGVEPVEREQFRAISVSTPLFTVVRGKYAIVGDAALHVKASTGGGLYYGFSAAEVLADALVSGSMHTYQRYHRTVLYPRLLVHKAVYDAVRRVGAHTFLSLLDDGKVLEKGDMNDPSFLFSREALPVTLRSAALYARSLLGFS